MKRKLSFHYFILFGLIFFSFLFIGLPRVENVAVGSFDLVASSDSKVECVNGSDGVAQLELYPDAAAIGGVVEVKSKGFATLDLNQYPIGSRVRIDIVQKLGSVPTKCYKIGSGNDKTSKLLNPEVKQIVETKDVNVVPVNSFGGVSNVLLLNKVGVDPAIVSVEIYSAEGDRIGAPNLEKIDLGATEGKKIDLTNEVGPDFEGTISIKPLVGKFVGQAVRGVSASGTTKKEAASPSASVNIVSNQGSFSVASGSIEPKIINSLLDPGFVVSTVFDVANSPALTNPTYAYSPNLMPTMGSTTTTTLRLSTTTTTLRPTTTTTTLRPTTTTTTLRPTTTTTTLRPTTTTTTLRPTTTTTTQRPTTTTTTLRPTTTTTTLRPTTTTTTLRPTTTTTTLRPTTTTTTLRPTTTTTSTTTTTLPTCLTCNAESAECAYSNKAPCYDLTMDRLDEEVKFLALKEEYEVNQPKKSSLEAAILKLQATIDRNGEQVAGFRRLRNEICGGKVDYMCMDPKDKSLGHAAHASAKEAIVKATVSTIPCVGDLAIEIYDVHNSGVQTLRGAQASVTTYAQLTTAHPGIGVVGNSDPTGEIVKMCVQQTVKDTKLAKVAVLGSKLSSYSASCLKANPIGLALNAGWYMSRYAINKYNGPSCKDGEKRISTDAVCYPSHEFEYFETAECKNNGLLSVPHPYCDNFGEGPRCCSFPGALRNPFNDPSNHPYRHNYHWSEKDLDGRGGPFPSCTKTRFESLPTIIERILTATRKAQEELNKLTTELNEVIQLKARLDRQERTFFAAKEAQEKCEHENNLKVGKIIPVPLRCNVLSPQEQRFCGRDNRTGGSGKPWKCGVWKRTPSCSDKRDKYNCGGCPQDHECFELGGNPAGNHSDPFVPSSTFKGLCRKSRYITEDCRLFHLCSRGLFYLDIIDPETGLLAQGCFSFRSANGFEPFKGEDMRPGVGNYNALKGRCG